MQVYVGRRNSKIQASIPGSDGAFGNPFAINYKNSRADVLSKYRAYITADTETAKLLRARIQKELKGKMLGCWCAPQDCHAEIIAEIANS